MAQRLPLCGWQVVPERGGKTLLASTDGQLDRHPQLCRSRELGDVGIRDMVGVLHEVLSHVPDDPEEAAGLIPTAQTEAVGGLANAKKQRGAGAKDVIRWKGRTQISFAPGAEPVRSASA